MNTEVSKICQFCGLRMNGLSLFCVGVLEDAQVVPENSMGWYGGKAKVGGFHSLVHAKTCPCPRHPLQSIPHSFIH